MQGSCYVDSHYAKQLLAGFHSRGGIYIVESLPQFECPFGVGVRGACLDPYYSIAADLRYHSAGEVLFFPALEGLPLPTGETHSGFMIVRDSGGAILGPDRFDFFTGFDEPSSSRNIFSQSGFGDQSNKLDYVKVPEDKAIEFRSLRAFPSVPSGTRGWGIAQLQSM
jgi:hypothetical protein